MTVPADPTANIKPNVMDFIWGSKYSSLQIIIQLNVKQLIPLEIEHKNA